MLLLFLFSLEVSEEIARADFDVLDVDTLEPHTPGSEDRLELGLNCSGYNVTILQDNIDFIVGDDVADDSLSQSFDFVVGLDRNLVLEVCTMFVVTSHGTISYVVNGPSKGGLDIKTLHFNGALHSVEADFLHLRREFGYSFPGLLVAHEAFSSIHLLSSTHDHDPLAGFSHDFIVLNQLVNCYSDLVANVS